MKIIQFQIIMRLFQPLTYYALGEDGFLYWAQPKNGQEIDWKQVKPPERQP